MFAKRIGGYHKSRGVALELSQVLKPKAFPRISKLYNNRNLMFLMLQKIMVGDSEVLAMHKMRDSHWI